MLLPRHNSSLHITHNPHLAYYETVEKYLTWGFNAGDSRLDDFISEEERQKAIDTNDMWEIQWYPDTPIGSYLLTAHDLDKLLIEAKRMQDEIDKAAL